MAHQLPAQAAQRPKAGDPVAWWLAPRLAARLEATGITTLAQLVERVHGAGRRWHAGIQGVGEGKAACIVDWLQSQPPGAGLQPAPSDVRAGRARHAPAAPAMPGPVPALLPLERLAVPQALDGTQGLNRCPQAQCLLPVSNDHQAILAWLHAEPGRGVPEAPGPDGSQRLSNTQRTYRKEAERFLLWAVLQQGKALSSMDSEDCRAYQAFLADPQPRSRWCGARGQARASPQWRPFEGPLSASAQRHATTVLHSLCRFLVDRHYLRRNPWSTVAVPRVAGPKLDAARSFSPPQWAFIVQQLQALPASAANRRLRLGLRLLHATGLRRSQLVAATVDHLRWAGHPADAAGGLPMQGWLLRVAGPGQPPRTLPLPAEVVAELCTDLLARGLAADPRHGGSQGACLLGQASDAAQRAPGLHGGQGVDARRGIAAATFHGQTKAFFAGCANLLRAQGDAAGAEHFARASAHWLRHTHARQAMADGLSIALAQHRLGHASPATTAAYAPAAQRRATKTAAVY